MKFKTETNPSQLKNFSRIPKSILVDTNLSFNYKKILLFLYGIQIHLVVPLDNIIRGWTNIKTLHKNNLIPSQLRKHLIWLEKNHYLTINRKNKKILSITLNIERPDIKNSKYFYIKKIFFYSKFLSLEHCAVATTYQYLNYMNNIYAMHASKILGIDEKTYRKYAKDLEEIGFLSTKKVIKQIYLRNSLSNFTKSIYFLKSTFIMKRRTHLTVRESFHSSLDDISCLIYIFTSKYINNSSVKEIFQMEKKKSGYDLVYFLNLKGEKFEEICRWIHYQLNIAGSFMQKELIEKKTKEYLISHCQKNKSTFMKHNDFSSYMVEILKKKTEVYSVLMDYINDNDFLEYVLSEIKKETGKEFGKNYLIWKIKNLKKDHFYKSFYTARQSAINLLLTDKINPYVTLDWDINYDPDLTLSIEKEIILREHKALDRKSKALHIPTIQNISNYLPKEFFDIKIPK